MVFRLATLVILFVVVVGAVFVLFKGTALVTGRDSRQARESGNGMQRLSFFLLLALIAYVAASGVS